MSKTKQPDLDYQLFEQAEPDIKMLTDQMRAVESRCTRFWQTISICPARGLAE
jgi:hypothetical protein